MQNRNQKPIRRVDVRQLEKLALLNVRKPNKNEATEKPGATHKVVRPKRWM